MKSGLYLSIHVTIYYNSNFYLFFNHFDPLNSPFPLSLSIYIYINFVDSW